MIETCFCPTSVEEAVRLLHDYQNDIRICAGGTDLFVMMRKGKSPCRYLLDISGTGLDSVRRESDGTIRIGASVTLTKAQYDPLLAGGAFECLREACGHVGSLQIRNAATLVGNICTGIPSADIATPLLVLEARVRAESVRGERIIPMDEFFKGPRKIALEPDEMVTEVILDAPSPDAAIASRFRKVGPRKELVISIFNIAVLAELCGDVAKRVRIAMGVVAPIPVRLNKTEAFLEGKPLEPSVVEEAIGLMQTEIAPRTSLHGSEAYRRLLAENLLRKYLLEIGTSRKEGDAE